MAAVALRLRLSVLWSSGRMAAWGRKVHVYWMRWPHSGDGGDHLGPDPYTPYGLVFGLLVLCYRQGRDFGAEFEADPGDRLLPDSLGGPTSPAVSASSSRPRAPSRESGGGRDRHWRQRSWTFGRSCEGKEDPYVYRDRDFGAERIRALSHIACGGCLLGITSRLCIGQR